MIEYAIMDLSLRIAELVRLQNVSAETSENSPGKLSVCFYAGSASENVEVDNQRMLRLF